MLCFALLCCAVAGYPSCLPALSSAAATRQLPVLVVGAALNTDVVPPEANWKRFTSAAAAGGSPVWELVLKGSSHLQFLDKQQPIFALFSNNGPTSDEVVRQITQVRLHILQKQWFHTHSESAQHQLCFALLLHPSHMHAGALTPPICQAPVTGVFRCCRGVECRAYSRVV
jgi:hypothetical protein